VPVSAFESDRGALSNVFDPFTLLLMVLAVVILLKLRSVLGRRTGHERPPIDPYTRPESNHDDNVVALPGANAPQTGEHAMASSEPPQAADWSDFADAVPYNHLRAHDNTAMPGRRLLFQTPK